MFGTFCPEIKCRARHLGVLLCATFPSDPRSVLALHSETPRGSLSHNTYWFADFIFTLDVDAVSFSIRNILKTGALWKQAQLMEFQLRSCDLWLDSDFSGQSDAGNKSGEVNVAFSLSIYCNILRVINGGCVANCPARAALWLRPWKKTVNL